MAIVAVAVMAAGCSSRDEVLPQEERVPILLTASVEGGAEGVTRAATDPTTADIQNSEFCVDEELSLFIKKKGGDWIANALQPYVVDENGLLSTNTSSSVYYPIDATPVVIYGTHPNSNYFGTSFTVRTDQSKVGDYAFSDLCYSKTKEYARKTTPHVITFKHVLSKIVITVDATGAGGGTVTNLKLRAKTSIPFTYPADNDNGYTLGTATTPNTITMNAAAASTGVAAIIPPQTTTADGEMRLTFDLAGVGPIAYDFPAGTEFLSGKANRYTVKVGSSITVTSTITDWGSSSSSNKTVEIGRPKLPIEYVGEYNMAATASDINGSGYYTATTHHMAADNTPQTSAYFRWQTAYDKFASRVTVAGYSGYYHLPSCKEWMSIIPPHYTANGDGNVAAFFPNISGSPGDRLFFENHTEPHTGLTEEIAWGAYWNGSSYSYDVDAVFYADYYCPQGLGTIGYGLRFKPSSSANGRYTCAYRYEYKASDVAVSNRPSLTISVKYVGANQAININTLNDESSTGFWKTSDFSILLPVIGHMGSGNRDWQSGSFNVSTINYPESAWYWASTLKESGSGGRAFCIAITTNMGLRGNTYNNVGDCFTVRLFKDAE